MNGLPGRVARIARETPQRTALVDGARTIDYGQFWRQAQAFAVGLREQGLVKGERLALLLPNRIEAAVACYGGWLAGAVVVPLNVQARERDFAPWLRHCGARHVVYEQGHRDAELALEQIGYSGSRTVLADAEPLLPPSEEAATPEFQTVEAGDTALILYTSGTTGAPKGVMLSYANCRELVAAARSALVTVSQPGVPAPPPVTQQPTVRTEPTSGPVPVQAVAQAHGPASQPFPSQQPGPMQPRPYQQQGPTQPQYGYAQAGDQPVRLRPPTPINNTAFREDGGAARWAVPVLAGTALLVILVVFIVWITA